MDAFPRASRESFEGARHIGGGGPPPAHLRCPHFLRFSARDYMCLERIRSELNREMPLVTDRRYDPRKVRDRASDVRWDYFLNYGEYTADQRWMEFRATYPDYVNCLAVTRYQFERELHYLQEFPRRAELCGVSPQVSHDVMLASRAPHNVCRGVAAPDSTVPLIAPDHLELGVNPTPMGTWMDLCADTTTARITPELPLFILDRCPDGSWTRPVYVPATSSDEAGCLFDAYAYANRAAPLLREVHAVSLAAAVRSVRSRDLRYEVAWNRFFDVIRPGCFGGDTGAGVSGPMRRSALIATRFFDDRMAALAVRVRDPMSDRIIGLVPTNQFGLVRPTGFPGRPLDIRVMGCRER